MKIPKDEITEIEEFIKKSEQGLFPADVTAYRVGECIIKYQAPELLEHIPESISSLIHDMISIYKKSGRVIHYSNLGEADHTDFTRQLIDSLEKRPSVSSD